MPEPDEIIKKITPITKQKIPSAIHTQNPTNVTIKISNHATINNIPIGAKTKVIINTTAINQTTIGNMNHDKKNITASTKNTIAKKNQATAPAREGVVNYKYQIE